MTTSVGFFKAVLAGNIVTFALVFYLGGHGVSPLGAVVPLVLLNWSSSLVALRAGAILALLGVALGGLALAASKTRGRTLLPGALGIVFLLAALGVFYYWAEYRWVVAVTAVPSLLCAVAGLHSVYSLTKGARQPG